MQRVHNRMADTRGLTGTGEATKNRNLENLSLTYADATNLYTHTEQDNVTEVNFTFSMSDGTAIPSGASVKWLPDGLNEAARIAAFSQTGGASVNVEYGRINLDTENGLRVSFTSFLTDIAFEPSIAGLRVTSVNQ